ncbi:hypothetical protein M9458_048567, partial [Cirrhinus mrigala]
LQVSLSQENLASSTPNPEPSPPSPAARSSSPNPLLPESLSSPRLISHRRIQQWIAAEPELQLATTPATWTW